MSDHNESPHAEKLDRFWDELISKPDSTRIETEIADTSVEEAVRRLQAMNTSNQPDPAFGAHLWEDMMHANSIPVSRVDSLTIARQPKRLIGKLSLITPSMQSTLAGTRRWPDWAIPRHFLLALAAALLTAIAVGGWLNREPDSPALVPAAVLTQATPEEAKAESSPNVLLDLVLPAGVFTPGPYGSAITFSIIPASSTSTWTTPVSAEIFYVMQGELTLNSQQSWQLVRGATPDVTETIPPGTDATLIEGDLAYFLGSFVTTFVNNDEQPVVIAIWGMSPAGGGGPPTPPEWSIGAYALTGGTNFEIPDTAIRVLLRRFHLPPEASVAYGPSQIGQLGVQLLSNANGTPTPANQGLYFFGPISNSAADSITVYAITLEAVDQATPTLGTPVAA